MGPLAGITVVEMAGIGPAPFAGMLLSDLGARVLRIDRPGGGWGGPADAGPVHADVVSRGRESIAIDLKSAEGVELVLRLVADADALVEGFRPMVMERLGLGPDVCLARNPRLVFGRMTGWGQDGPMADRAGHDINYISLSGALAAVGRAGQPPVPPLNLVGDYGGGGMLLAYGVVCGLLSAARGGAGQVVDAAMVDGSALLMAQMFGMRAQGLWSDERGTNLLDTGAPFYDVYATADGGHVSVGPIEPAFFAELVAVLGLEDVDLARQYDAGEWPALRAQLAAAFATATRDEWADRFATTDACVAPVLAMGDAPSHPHNVARGTFLDREGIVQPAPAPRFSGTPAEVGALPPRIGQHTDSVLLAAGLSEGEISALRSRRVVQ